MDVDWKLPDPAWEAHTWIQDGEHNPASQSPLTLWMAGMEQAGADDVPTNIKVNGYAYWRLGGGGAWPTIDAPGVDLSPLQRWQQVWLPRVDAHVQGLLDFEPGAVVPGTWRETIEGESRAAGELMLGVHATSLSDAWRAADGFLRAYRTHFGEERREDGPALLHGFENATLRRGGALWELSRMVAADGDLRKAVERWAKGEPLPPGEFATALDAFLEHWGLTIDRSMQDLPTWREEPRALAASILAEASRPDGEGPLDAHRRAVARREQLESHLRAAAASKPPVAELLEQLPRAQELPRVSEDHNVLCDQRLFAASRMRWLAVGEHLRTAGGVDAPDDVFFHTPDELIAALEGGTPLTRAEIAARRDRQQSWRDVRPPAYLGTPPPDDRPKPPAGDAMIHGTGASPGTHRGRARLARTLEEASRLEPGDVLVCSITSPAWTPLFGLAGAVVTDGGGLLSHPAIVAREFGIPAVVGCRDATARIREGDEVIVDGSRGTVEVVRSS